MSDSRKIIDIYIDTENSAIKKLVGSTFYDPDSTMTLWRGTQILFRCHLMLSDATTYFAPPTGATWFFGIDNVYTSGHAELVSSLNADFVAADWASADFDNGKVCWRVDMTAQALIDALGNDASDEMYAALWMTPSGGEPVLMAHWDLIVHNVAVDPTTATETPGLVYVTTDMMSVYQKRHEDGASIQFQNGQHPYVYCGDDSLWYPLVVQLVDGTAVLGLGEGVASP